MLNEAPHETSTFDRTAPVTEPSIKIEEPASKDYGPANEDTDLEIQHTSSVVVPPLDPERFKAHMYLLTLVCAWFGLFAIAEIIAAEVSNSLSLLGDAACMLVDSGTYGMNMVAEACKRNGISERRRLMLELFIPLVSMCALIATSCYILHDASITIREGGTTGDESTNASMMLIFSCVGLGMDAISVFSFTYVQGFLGFETVDHPEGRHIKVASNTNMCSAYSHVLADTGRSVAAIVAAIVALKVAGVNAGLADAWAAVSITIIIFITLIPLGRGLIAKTQQLRHLESADK